MTWAWPISKFQKKEDMFSKTFVVIAIAIAIHKLAKKENEASVKTATELIRSCSQLLSKASLFMLALSFYALINDFNLWLSWLMS
ncbi:MAG: hypothetical protein CMJ20_01875 [Phycisphaeraceae bacterium]|nr:hypothetical protein [Phycisphaeraceae bacterium]